MSLLCSPTEAPSSSAPLAFSRRGYAGRRTPRLRRAPPIEAALSPLGRTIHWPIPPSHSIPSSLGPVHPPHEAFARTHQLALIDHRRHDILRAPNARPPLVPLQLVDPGRWWRRSWSGSLLGGWRGGGDCGHCSRGAGREGAKPAGGLGEERNENGRSTWHRKNVGLRWVWREESDGKKLDLISFLSTTPARLGPRASATYSTKIPTHLLVWPATA